MGRPEKVKIDYDQTVLDWLNSQKVSTREIYKCNFKHIVSFTKGMTGKEILESRKADLETKQYNWEKKTVELKLWAKEQNMSDSVGRNLTAILRSFFVFYRVPLVFTRAETNKIGNRGKRTTKDYELTNEAIAKMVFVADLREKYIVLGGKSFGLRAIDFIGLTYGTFRSVNLEQEAPIFLGETNTIKENVIAFPFIDSDLVPVIKQILESGASHADNEQILTFNENELSTVLQKLAEKANIQLGDKHLRFHCFRKYLSDRLSSVMAESKWKQIVGKSISEGAYISHLDLKENYAKVMKLTTINTNGNGKVTKLSQEVTEIKNRLDVMQKENFDLKYNFEVLVKLLAKKGIDASEALREHEEILDSHEEEERKADYSPIDKR